MITPEEAAKLTYDFALHKDDAKVKSFILEASPRQLQEFIHLITADSTSSYFNWARVALDIRLAEESERTAIRLERHTKHLLVITYLLTAITVGLLVLAYFQMKHDDHPNQHSQNYYEHHKYAV
jgi:hypothetical protein